MPKSPSALHHEPQSARGACAKYVALHEKLLDAGCGDTVRVRLGVDVQGFAEQEELQVQRLGYRDGGKPDNA